MKNDLMKNFLKSFDTLTDSEINDFINSATSKHLKKHDYYIKEGEICSSITFVLSGILRSYHTSEKGDDFTYCITFPNNFMTAYSSFLTNQPTKENIQAITETELLIISKEKIQLLSHQNNNWTHFQKIIAEQQYVELEKRIFLLQSSDAKKRYANLMENQPKYIKNIPLQYLASYLGISQRHLSRIRKDFSF
ncbi:Crp/Fnr family transcriptional regulator [Tenacibaculum pacificus]|uniref:Crp/Fnr family transcriptional regulator n=1 Tax=Tenacibaculum pacificus TaxID=3018314 RepID=UPI0022F3D95B|nr:Crp/Fnr family transcriptional regulator [Tenacibaculum pacificus]WBX73327.1 Crp/Fnr family transcriptional regulator [Tenacibaculum pacificus]